MLEENKIRERVEELRREKVRSNSSGSNCLWTKVENAELNVLLDVLEEEQEAIYEINGELVIDYLKRNKIKPSPLLTGDLLPADIQKWLDGQVDERIGEAPKHIKEREKFIDDLLGVKRKKISSSKDPIIEVRDNGSGVGEDKNATYIKAGLYKLMTHLAYSIDQNLFREFDLDHVDIYLNGEKVDKPAETEVETEIPSRFGDRDDAELDRIFGIVDVPPKMRRP